MTKSRSDCGDPKCPFPEMPTRSEPEDTEADYFVEAMFWMQKNGYHDITTACRIFKCHGIRMKFDDETLRQALQKNKIPNIFPVPRRMR